MEDIWGLCHQSGYGRFWVDLINWLSIGHFPPAEGLKGVTFWKSSKQLIYKVHSLSSKWLYGLWQLGLAWCCPVLPATTPHSPPPQCLSHTQNRQRFSHKPSARRCGTGARNTQQLQKLSCIPRPIVISQQSWTQPWPLTGSRVHKPSAECDSNVSNTWILPAPSGIKQFFFFFWPFGGKLCIASLSSH